MDAQGLNSIETAVTYDSKYIPSIADIFKINSVGYTCITISVAICKLTIIMPLSVFRQIIPMEP